MRNLISQGYIIDASPELVPVLRISPFSPAHLGSSPSVNKSHGDKVHEYLLQRLGDYHLYPKGRSAISQALASLGLRRDDVVTILTTSGNFYISGCVTKEIEKYCAWSRKITERTKAIFVNHEFGYPYEGLSELRSYGLPIIEDCAHAFFSENKEMGTVGDFVVYSLPKAFPLQLGGVLVSRSRVLTPVKSDEALEHYISSHLVACIDSVPEYKEKRLRNYHLLRERLAPLGIEPFFPLKPGVVPGVFLFRWSDSIDYPALKIFMQNNGIECSVFYGQNAFFIPNHQDLSEAEIVYMCELLKTFSKS